jgi:hypothetical protein
MGDQVMAAINIAGLEKDIYLCQFAQYAKYADNKYSKYANNMLNMQNMQNKLIYLFCV